METPTPESPNYYAILPASVRFDDRISSSEKLFYAEVTALSNLKGYCYASNKYFSKQYDVKNSTVSLWVKNLAESGHIRVEYDRKNKQVIQRRIYPLQKFDFTYSENQNTLVRKSEYPSQKIGIPQSENPKENTKIENSKIEYKGFSFDSFNFNIPERLVNDKKFMDLFFDELLKSKNWKKKSHSAIQKTIDQLKKYRIEFIYKLINQTIANDWKGLIYENTDTIYKKWSIENPPIRKNKIML
jgi:hypothetical protein